MWGGAGEGEFLSTAKAIALANWSAYEVGASGFTAGSVTWGTGP